MNITDRTMPDSQTIACLGDSITAGYCDEEGLGWVSRLSNMIARKHPLKYGVMNAGISGDTSRDAWHNMIRHVTHIGPEMLIIKVGVNDCCIREGAETESPMCSYIDRMNTWNNIMNYTQGMGWKTLVVGPLPIEHAAARFPAQKPDIPEYKSLRYEQKDIAAYNDMLEGLCKQKSAPFLRLFEDWMANLDEGLFADGLHPNAKGHQRLADQVFDKIEALEWV